MVGGSFVGDHRHLVAADVVRMRVAAVFVVGGQHVRLELADQPNQRFGGLDQRHHREASLGQCRQWVALGQSGIDEPQPFVFDAQDLCGSGHLVAADFGHPPVDLG